MEEAELESLFRAELKKQIPDAALIRTLMDVLRERNRSCTAEITPTIEQAWNGYNKKSQTLNAQVIRKKKYRNWIIRTAASAALFIILLSAIPQKASADGFWDRLTLWTSDVLEFFSHSDNDGRLSEYSFTSENPDLQQVYLTLSEEGITAPVVPMWIPEGYLLSECKVMSLPAKKTIVCVFENDTDTITLSFGIYETEVAQKFQKDETDISHFEAHNTDHIIMRNNEYWSVLWYQEKIECSLFIRCQEDTLYRIIESIYVMEDK